MQAVGWPSAAKGNAPCSREETWRGRDARDRVNEARAGRLRARSAPPTVWRSGNGRAADTEKRSAAAGVWG